MICILDSKMIFLGSEKHNVAFKLFHGYLQKPYIIFMNNFYSSPFFFYNSKLTSTRAVGTLRLNCKGILWVWLIFLNCRHENLSFHNFMLGKLRWKHIMQHIFPAYMTTYFLQLLKTNLLSETTISWAQTAYICLNSAILALE